MRSLIALVLLLLITSKGVSAAEEVLVVSGEHDGYTRLVFTVLPDQDWILSTANTSAAIRFTSPDLTFDKSRLFDRISTSRLEAVQVSHGDVYTEFNLQLGCDCDVTAFSYLEQYVVVDIADRKSREEWNLVLAPAVWMTPTAPSFVNGPLEVNFPSQSEELTTSGYLTTQAPDAPPARMHVDQGINPQGASAGEEIRKAVNLAHSSLLQQVLVAADQGLLELTSFTPEVNESPSANNAESSEEIHAHILDGNQVTIQTVFDRDAGEVSRLIGVEGNRCPPEKTLDIASWADGDDFPREISLVRKNIFKEFDDPDYAVIEQLLKTYLRYGFGAEARRYLLEYGPDISNEEIYSDMAAIVDGHSARPQGAFSRATNCDGPAGLWAMVGHYPDVRGPTGDLGSIIDAFAKLPLNVRRILGPRLVFAFVYRGKIESARLVSNILERAAGEITNDHKLAIGNLLEAEGHVEEALSAYQSLSEGTSSVAVDALIKMASLGLEMDQPFPNILGDLNAAVGMWRGTKKEKPLRRLEAFWTARLIGGSEAVGLLTKAINKEPAMADLLGQTAFEIIQNISTDESGYAAIIHSYRDYIPSDNTSNKLRLTIAERLTSEGLPDLAIDILYPLVKRENTVAMLATSKAHLKAFRPDEALSILANITSDQAGIRRVETYLFDDDFDNALEELQEFENQDSAVVQPGWYAGDWANIVLVNSAAAKIRSDYFSNSTERRAIFNDVGEQPITLSLIQDILESSRTVSGKLRSEIFR